MMMITATFKAIESQIIGVDTVIVATRNGIMYGEINGIIDMILINGASGEVIPKIPM